MKKRHFKVLLILATLIAPLLPFLAGLDSHESDIPNYRTNENPRVVLDLPNVQPKPSKSWAIVYGYAEGGMDPFWDADKKLKTERYDLIHWASIGMFPSLQKKWGIGQDFLSKRKGGIFYWPGQRKEAERLQVLITKQVPWKQEVLPLIPVSREAVGGYVGKDALAQNSLLVLKPGYRQTQRSSSLAPPHAFVVPSRPVT